MTRQRDHDARRIAAGWRRVPVWLDPETAEAVRCLAINMDPTDTLSHSEAIRRAILSADAPYRHPQASNSTR